MRNFSEFNTLLSTANILETLLKNVLLGDLMTAFSKLAEFNKVFDFEKCLIYVLPKFN